MKKSILLCFVIILGLTACKKNSAGPASTNLIDTFNMPNGCISRLTYSTASTIKPADLATTIQLFNKNNISTSNLSFYKFNHDTTTKYYLPGQYIFINAVQYYKGVPIFTSDLIWEFYNDNVTFTSGNRYTSLNPDTTSTPKLQALRKLFLDQLNKDVNYAYNGMLGGKIYQDSCLTAQFGYYDLGLNASPPTPGNLIKVWLVAPKGKSYPYAYFKDDKLNTLLGYNDGIVTLF